MSKDGGDKPIQDIKPISKKDKAMADTWLKDPKITKTDAYAKTHTVRAGTKLSSIQTQASDTFNKPEVKSYIDKYSGLIEETLVSTVADWGHHEKPRQREIALDAAKFMHDKIHGKATQKIETQSTVLKIDLDLTGVTSDDQQIPGEPA